MISSAKKPSSRIVGGSLLGETPSRVRAKAPSNFGSVTPSTEKLLKSLNDSVSMTPRGNLSGDVNIRDQEEAIRRLQQEVHNQAMEIQYLHTVLGSDASTADSHSIFQALSDQLSEKTAELEEAKLELSEARKLVKIVQNDLLPLKETVADKAQLEKDYVQLEDYVKEREQELDRLKEERNAMIERLSELEDSLRQKEGNLDDFQEELKEKYHVKELSHLHRIDQLTHDLEQLQSSDADKTAERNNTVHTLQEQLNTLKSSNDTLQRENLANVAAKTKLQQQLELLQREQTALTQQLADKEKECTSLRADQVKQVTEHQDFVKIEQHRHTQQLKEQEEKLTFLLESTKLALDKKLSESDLRIVELESMLIKKQTEYSITTSQQTAEIDALRQALKEKQELYLKAALHDDSKEEDLRQQLSVSRKSYDRLLTQYEDQKQSQTALEYSVRDVSRQLQDVQRQLEEKEREMEKLRREGHGGLDIEKKYLWLEKEHEEKKRLIATMTEEMTVQKQEYQELYLSTLREIHDFRGMMTTWRDNKRRGGMIKSEHPQRPLSSHRLAQQRQQQQQPTQDENSAEDDEAVRLIEALREQLSMMTTKHDSLEQLLSASLRAFKKDGSTVALKKQAEKWKMIVQRQQEMLMEEKKVIVSLQSRNATLEATLRKREAMIQKALDKMKVISQWREEIMTQSPHRQDFDQLNYYIHEASRMDDDA